MNPFRARNDAGVLERILSVFLICSLLVTGVLVRSETAHDLFHLQQETGSEKVHSHSHHHHDFHAAGLLSGITITNTYDALLRRDGLGVLNQGTNTYQVNYAYDDASRLASVSQATNAATYFYVPNSRLIDGIAFNNGANVVMNKTNQWDFLQRATSVQHSLWPGGSKESTPSISHSYVYNTANQRTKMTLANGSYWRYEYDDLGQVVSGKKYWSTGVLVRGMQNEYDYDDIGNRISASWGGDAAGNNLRTESYSANSLNQYTGRTNPGYVQVLGEAKTNATVTVNFQSTFRNGTFFQSELAFNNAQALYASITNIAVLQDSPNPDIVSTNIGTKLIPPATETIHYDLDGNMTSDGLWTNTWNGENRLIAMETSTAAASGGVPKRKLAFAYDPLGRRIQKTVYSWDTDHWEEDESHLFAYDGWNLLLDMDGNKAPNQSTVWGLDLSGSAQGAGGVGGLLFWNDTATGTSHFAASDANGNVVGLADSATATASASYEYDAFGKVLVKKGEFCDLNGWRFSSKLQDEISGYLYYGFRYYSAIQGRWLTRDPINERGGLNVNSFVGNDLQNFYDPLGLILNYNCEEPCYKQYKDYIKRVGMPHSLDLMDRFIALCRSRKKAMACPEICIGDHCEQQSEAVINLFKEAADALAGELAEHSGVARMIQMLILAYDLKKGCGDVRGAANSCEEFGRDPSEVTAYACCTGIISAFPGVAEFAHIKCTAIAASF